MLDVGQHLNYKMKIPITFIIFFVLFGCKNHPNSENKSFIEPKIDTLEKKKTESIFDLITNKKESPKNFPDNISHRFDYSKRFSKKEIIILNLDTTKIGSNEYYILTNQLFLKRQIDSIPFIIYYKHQYGDQFEKILRIIKKDTVFDLTLSMKGGDSFSQSISTEFVNDSIFIETFIHRQTAIDNTHLMTYATDSIVKKYKYNGEFEFKEIKKDSFHIYKEYPTYHKNLKGKVFKTWGSPFTINGIQCKWEYEVMYTDEANENSKDLLVNLISQKIINIKTRKPILDLDLSTFAYNPPKNIIDLEYNNKYLQSAYDEIKDINSDGHNDIQFLTEIAAAGANTGYASYLYNPTKKIFEYSEIFSGYNIEYNSEKNRISTFGKSGVDDYYYSFINLKENRKDVAFIERLHHYFDTIFYKKIINQKIVEEKKVVLGEYEGWTKYLERN